MRAGLSVILYYQIIGFLAFGTYGVSEENKCKLSNGNEGVCALLPNCHAALEKIGIADESNWEPSTCGSVEFADIVCCPVDIWKVTWTRPAEHVCQEYRQRYYTDQKKRQNKISYGNEVQEGEFPYVVGLGYKSLSDDDVMSIAYSCIGTLISDEIVLTSASCASAGYKVPVEVLLGALEVNSTDGIRIPIEKIIVHPQYRRNLDYHDLAIIKLKTKVQITDKIKPICLQTEPLSKVNSSLPTLLVVSGWGRNVIKSNRIIKSNDLEIVDSEQCYEFYSNRYDNMPNRIINSQICTVEKEGSVIRPDCVPSVSGSPLLMLTDSGERLVGVSSLTFFVDCHKPEVNTAVYPYLDWIEETVWPSLNWDF